MKWELLANSITMAMIGMYALPGMCSRTISVVSEGVALHGDCVQKSRGYDNALCGQHGAHVLANDAAIDYATWGVMGDQSAHGEMGWLTNEMG